MAKKKASSKKSSVKKVVKKTESKTKKTSKAPKALKKAPKKVIKKAAPVKKGAAKKLTPKKSMGKKVVAKKAPAKAIKAGAKKVKSSKNVSSSHLTKAAPAMKKLDLSAFVTPLDDRLMVRTSSAERMTPGGLYIPDTVSDTSGNLEGFVVAAGRGHMNKKGHVRPMDVKVGDRVVFSQHAGSKIKIQNEDLVILREADVMGVVSK